MDIDLDMDMPRRLATINSVWGLGAGYVVEYVHVTCYMCAYLSVEVDRMRSLHVLARSSALGKKETVTRERRDPGSVVRANRTGRVE